MMKTKNFLSYLGPAFKLCSKNKSLFFLSVLFDILFFLSVIAGQFWVLLSVKGSVLRIMDIVQQNLVSAVQSGAAAQVSSGLLKTPELISEYKVIMKYFFLMVLIFFVSWLVFRGVSWFIAHRMSGRVDIKRFVKQFFLFSLFAFVFGFIWLLVVLRLIAYSSSSFLPVVSVGMDHFFLFLGFAVLNYFLFITYSLIPSAGCRIVWNAGISKYRQFVPAYLLWLVSICILGYLTVWVIRLNYWAPVIFALLAAFPAVAYGRIYILVVVNKVLKRGR